MTNIQSNMRTNFLHALETLQTQEAICLGNQLLEESTTTRQYSFICKSIKNNPKITKDLPSIRIALLSTFSIDFIQDSLVALGFLSGLYVKIYQSGFAQFRQEILNPASGLYEFKPEIAILALEGKHIASTLYHDYSDLLESKIDLELQNVSEEIRSLVKSFKENTDATLLIHNLVEPKFLALGILDGQRKKGQSQTIHDLNNDLYQISKEHQGVFIINYQALINRFGYTQWYDKRMELYAQAPVAQAMMPNLSREYIKYFRALKGLSKKCLIVDLDNTLWGGIVGEDGPDGIKLDQYYPGNAYIEFQETILNLYKRGIILAISSKNNIDDINEVFMSHPNMVLKKNHFATMEINWNPKSESIKNIAKNLNIGLEHIVFVDDNPVECDQVKEALPTVSVIHLGQHPEKFSELLDSDGLFDTINFTVEDKNRNQLYKQREKSEDLKNHSMTLKDFYRNLKMSVSFRTLDSASLARAAQLTQKTNQFNLTTIRYTEVELSEKLNDPEWMQVTVQVTDRYGDNGIVGFMMAKKESKNLLINTFLLSCRVIGRTIETAMLAFICQYAKANKLKKIFGEIIPTQKNIPVRDLFQQHEFILLESDTNGRSMWQYTIKEDLLPYPDWLHIVSNKH